VLECVKAEIGELGSVFMTVNGEDAAFLPGTLFNEIQPIFHNG
jgi:sorbitol-specific phosphotransferase system component IIA